MTGTLIRKEFREFLRDRRFLVLFALMLVLLSAASLDGWNRARSDAAARAHAAASDREIWVEQGENNPHGAAHFARYAFRPTPSLAAFDPGVFDFAGAAVWLEAHTQNPAALRRAEDAAIATPFPTLSAAWVIQVIGTLALTVLLFQAVAGERERGTLRALAATGLSASRFVAGKTGAVLLAVGGLCLLIFLAVLLPGAMSGDLDAGAMRIATLAGTYLCALTGFALIVVAISARSRSQSAAFVLAIGFWVSVSVILPVIGGQLAASLHPDIDEQELKNAIQLEAQSPFWSGDAREPAVAAYEAEVLEEFGAARFEDLGFDREALVLQAHEEFANEVYDRLYGELYARHEAQDRMLRYLAIASPVLALQRLSSGLAETDLTAQLRFTRQAEAHRRRIIEQLNRDMMMNAGESGYAYTADRSLWEDIPDFQAEPVSTLEILERYRIEVLALLVWLLAGFTLAIHLSGRAMKQERL